MNKFDKYTFVKTDASKSTTFFQLEGDVSGFMNEFRISLDDFKLSDVVGEFVGLDFALEEENGSFSLEYGPIYYIEEEDSYTTVDWNPCDIDGLAEYIYSRFK